MDEPQHVTRLVDVALVADPDDIGRYVTDAHRMLADLVSNDAALGWVDPPESTEIEQLLASVARDSVVGDAALAIATSEGRLVGLGYWRRYSRPTHRVHADLERVAVAIGAQRQGLGRALASLLVDAARVGGIEQLTLDLRSDNEPALRLYEGLGFRQYGHLADFVAVGERRLGKIFMVLDLR
ncbi:MAG TPA: N-acetyltransferase [Actinomycetes bacterium]|nr:N-acetyltransferase [Actinomycetes bacterium]